MGAVLGASPCAPFTTHDLCRCPGHRSVPAGVSYLCHLRSAGFGRVATSNLSSVINLGEVLVNWPMADSVVKPTVHQKFNPRAPTRVTRGACAVWLCFVLTPVPSIAVCLLELCKFKCSLNYPLGTALGCQAGAQGLMRGHGSPSPCALFGLMMWLCHGEGGGGWIPRWGGSPTPRVAYLIPCVLGMLRLWREATRFAQGAAAL